MRELLKRAAEQIKESNPLDDINLFSILGMENKEVSAHSAFLYYIFKPFKGIDGKRDDANLRILLQYLKDEHSLMIKKEIEHLQFLNIRREVPFDNGRLDFLLEFDSDAVVIELKVWAGEQPYQIERYRKYLRQNGYTDDNVFFLTPGGKEATTGEARAISLKDDMRTILQRVCKERLKYTQYNAIIQQYLSLIVRLTGDNTMNANEIIKSKKDIKACDALYNLRQEILTQILERFLAELQGAIVNNGKLTVASNTGKTFNLVIPDITADNKRNYLDTKYFYRRGYLCYPAIIFALDRMDFKHKDDLQDGQELYFYVEIEDTLYCGITTRTNITNSVSLSNKFQDYANKVKHTDEPTHKGLHLYDGNWWSWERATYNGHPIHFRDYANENEGVFSILKDDSLDFIDGSIDAIAKSVLESFKRQYNYFFTPGI